MKKNTFTKIFVNLKKKSLFKVATNKYCLNQIFKMLFSAGLPFLFREFMTKMMQ